MTTLKCRTNRFHQSFSLERKFPRQHEDIVKIFHAAILSSQNHHGVELFSNNSFTVIRTNARRWKIENGWELDIVDFRRKRIAYPYVHLNWDNGAPKPGGEPHPLTMILLCPAYSGDADFLVVKQKTVILYVHFTNGPEGLFQTVW